MKRIFIFLGVLCFIIMIAMSCNNGSNNDKSLSTDIVKNPNTANGVSDTSKLPAFKFEEEIHDFGWISTR